MSKLFLFFLFPLLILFGGCANQSISPLSFPPGKVQHAVHVGSLAWKPCPPSLPKGCEIAVLEGSPKQANLFTVRIRTDRKFLLSAHTHPKDERVTVLSGKVAVAFGKDAQLKEAKVFGPGDYYVNSRGAVHKVWGLEPATIQITGIGPWQTDFID